MNAPFDFLHWAKVYHDLGYNVLPAAGKAVFVKEWTKWADFRQAEDDLKNLIAEHLDSAPTTPITGIGIALGPYENGEGVIALDIDTANPEFLLKAQALARSPMVKVGAKGFTAFYRYTDEWAVKDQDDRALELLTGGQQTIVPPSIHPDTGSVYSWDLGTRAIEACKLPEFDREVWDELKAIAQFMKLERPKRKGGAVGSSGEGRNSHLSNVAWALVNKGISLRDGVAELLEHDKKYNNPPWFYDKGEPHGGRNPAATAEKMLKNKLKKYEKDTEKLISAARASAINAANLESEREEEDVDTSEAFQGEGLTVDEFDFQRGFNEETASLAHEILDFKNDKWKRLYWDAKALQGSLDSANDLERFDEMFKLLLDGSGPDNALASFSSAHQDMAAYRVASLEFGAAVGLISTVIGNHLSIGKKSNLTKTQTFVVNVAGSGVGKNSLQDLVKLVLFKTSKGKHYIGQATFRSGQAAFLGFDMAVSRFTQFCVIDEASGTLGRASQSGFEDIIPNLNKIYSASNSVIGEQKVMNKNNTIPEIVCPILVAFMSTTPEALKKTMNRDMLVSGFAARMVFTYSLIPDRVVFDNYQGFTESALTSKGSDAFESLVAFADYWTAIPLEREGDDEEGEAVYQADKPVALVKTRHIGKEDYEDGVGLRAFRIGRSLARLSNALGRKGPEMASLKSICARSMERILKLALIHVAATQGWKEALSGKKQTLRLTHEALDWALAAEMVTATSTLALLDSAVATSGADAVNAFIAAEEACLRVIKKHMGRHNGQGLPRAEIRHNYRRTLKRKSEGPIDSANEVKMFDQFWARAIREKTLIRVEPTDGGDVRYVAT